MLVRTREATGVVETTTRAGAVGSAAARTVVGVWHGAVTQQCELAGVPCRWLASPCSVASSGQTTGLSTKEAHPMKAIVTSTTTRPARRTEDS